MNHEKLWEETLDIIRKYPDKFMIKLWNDMSDEQKREFIRDNLFDEAMEWVEAGCLRDFQEGGTAVIEVKY
jgi:hypothetical protein